MIPRLLTIQGLYSYQNRQTIDFTKLTGACLFGIFGTVGSGKSSILEAITYAIYGETDRLNLSGDNRNYNMMNLKSNELLIDFIFETGKNQTAYRSIVKGRRNSKRFEDVRALERSAFKMVDSDWVPIELNSLVEAVGLSYANFKRTIIIPQGQFQEFLQLGNRDRSIMMKELFNLEKFEFYYKTVALESKNNEQIQNIKGQLLQLGEIDPGQVDVYDRRLKELETTINLMTVKQEAYQHKEEVYRSLRILSDKIVQGETRLSTLLLKEPGFVALENKIERYEQCVLRFKHLLDRLKSGVIKVVEHEKLIKADSIRYDDLALSKDKIKNHLIGLKLKYEKRDEMKKKAEELDLMLRVKTLEETLVKESLRIVKGSEILKKAVDNIECFKQERVHLEVDKNRVSDEMPDLGVLSNVRAWYVERRGITSQLKEVEGEIVKSVNVSTALNNEKSVILAEDIFENLSVDSTFEDCSIFLQEKINLIKTQQNELMSEDSRLRVRERLSAYAEALNEGTPCPVCGSLHHPEKYKSEEVSEALFAIDKNKTALGVKLDHILQLDKQLASLESRIEHNAVLIREYNDKKSILTNRLTEHDKQFVWDSYTDEEKLNEAFNNYERLSVSLKSLEKRLIKVGAEIDNAEIDKERFRNELEKIGTSLTVHKTELSTITEQIKVIDVVEYKTVEVDVIEKEKKLLFDEVIQVEKDFNVYTENLKLLNKEIDTLIGSLEANKGQLEAERKEIETLNDKINSELSTSTFTSIEEVNSILTSTFNIDSEKQRVSAYNKELENAKSTLEQLKNELGDIAYDENKHIDLIKDIELIRDQIAVNVKEQVETTMLFKRLLADLEVRISLDKMIEGLELRSENIKILKSLFKASGFVNYISSVYLQNLCNAANHRFTQITRQRLSLEITSDNSFQVVDYMNGGKRRSVKTLSGGQTFQASLSLALALADNIQKITQSNQNFFFLDEGFGSLDKESLETVFDTLKLLRKENRIVGVISHVEEMQQEIEVHLRVENANDSGSIIYASWEE